jgi:transposase
LAERVKRPPEDGGLWSGPKVAAWMARHLGLAEVHPQRGWEALKRIGWSLQAPRPRHPRAATPERRAAFRGGSMPPSPAQARAAHPDRPVEVRAEDEHRLGLKPVRRRVWAPVGQRPTALGHHRYLWLYVVAFVRPTSGEAVWFLSTGLSKPFFEALLAAFALETGAGRERHIVLVLDNAGWHGPKGLAVPEGISLVFLPPYSPELQPAEHLWPLVDEPVVNRHFATLADLEAVVAERCRRLDAAAIGPHTDFHWWPRPISPN